MALRSCTGVLHWLLLPGHSLRAALRSFSLTLVSSLTWSGLHVFSGLCNIDGSGVAFLTILRSSDLPLNLNLLLFANFTQYRFPESIAFFTILHVLFQSFDAAS